MRSGGGVVRALGVQLVRALLGRIVRFAFGSDCALRFWVGLCASLLGRIVRFAWGADCVLTLGVRICMCDWGHVGVGARGAIHATDFVQTGSEDSGLSHQERAGMLLGRLLLDGCFAPDVVDSDVMDCSAEARELM